MSPIHQTTEPILVEHNGQFWLAQIVGPAKVYRTSEQPHPDNVSEFPTKKPHRTWSGYTKEQKQDIVLEFNNTNATAEAVAKKYGVSVKSVYTWRKQLGLKPKVEFGGNFGLYKQA